jgi:hypothetical protein
MRKFALLFLGLGIMFGLCLLISFVQQNATGSLTWPGSKTWIEAVLDTKKSVADRVEKNNIPFDSLNVDLEMRNLLVQFPSEMSAVMPYIRSNARKFLSGMDGSSEEAIINEISKSFRSTSWFDARIINLKSEANAEMRISGLLDLFLIALEINKVDEQLKWLNLPAIEAAVNDMKSDESFDPEEATRKLDELKRLVGEGFSGIYHNDPVRLLMPGKLCSWKGIFYYPTPCLTSTASWSAGTISEQAPGW